MEQQAQQQDGGHSATPPIARAAYTVPEFCEAFRISRSLLYDELRRGTGPLIFKIGKCTRISVEAAEEWRRRMEATA